MSDPNNPFDNTVWDPDGEHAIEDPFHGPSAVHNMLQTPAMPLGDGRYYQPGAYDSFGTPYLDSHDQPIREFIICQSMVDSMREGQELHEWLEAYHQGGEEALTAIETKRQQRRLDETGFAHCFKPSDVCPGGKKMQDCVSGSEAFEKAQEWANKNSKKRPSNGVTSNVIDWAGGKCTECMVSCEVAVKTVDGTAQETRVSYFRPDPNIQTIELHPYEPRILTDEESETFKKFFGLDPDQSEQ